MTLERIPVEPSVIEWARRTAGLDVPTAAKKLSVSQRSVEQWEAGQLAPTVGQLRKAAKAYRRPLAVLLLPRAPRDFQPVGDFRRVADGGPMDWSPALIAEMKRAESQREVLLEIAELAPASAAPESEFPHASVEHSPEVVSERVRAWLSLDSVSRSTWSRPRDALNTTISVVEEKGVLLLHTRGVDIKEMRGFSIAEFPYPVIALNGKDWPRPRLFTLFHEIAHLALADGGVCDLHERSRNRAPEDRVEHFCNQVAAAILVPRDQILRVEEVVSATADYSWSLEELESLSRPFGSSAEAMLLRLISLGKASWATYRARKSELEDEYEEARERERAQQREREGGPSYYVVKARDLGHGYVSTVVGAYEAKAITSLDAADYLEVRFDQISALEAAAR